MRVILGLAALAAVASPAMAAQLVTPNSGNGVLASSPPLGTTALASISVYQTVQNGVVPVSSPSGQLNSGGILPSSNWGITIPNSVTTVVFVFNTNQYTAQMEYRWGGASYLSFVQGYSSSYNAATYTCDPCAGGTPSTCSFSGPNTSPSPAQGFPCASFVRAYTFSGLTAGTNSFSVCLFDTQTNPSPDFSSYSFIITRQAPLVHGDPQIVGLQGQDFQVHGMPDEIFNMITYPNLQVNARFVYLSSGACHDNFTACFAHPGTYISEEGIRLGSDKIHVAAGSFKKGLTVSVNGKKVTEKNTSVKLGSVELVNHRRVVVKTPIMAITISNSDKFLNQETQLFDQKLLALGAERTVLGDGEGFHSEVPLHGLQGQTWRNVEYPSGLEYEGSISDYHVTSGNIYGTEFVFNQFKQ